MRRGEVINGYTVVEDFSTKDAGLSKWTFATREGLDFFIKEFLAPKYPLPDAPGSAAGKSKRLEECLIFEAHHRRLMDLTQPVAARGGNLIVTLDFFRQGANYYKVTERIDAETLDPARVSRLPMDDRLVILSAATHSLRILHRAGIVHGDLKPSNVMVKPTKHAYTAKLIDFDNAYLTGDPPSPEDLVGTINYYAPEVYLYLKGRLDPMDLTIQADIFALGLVFAQILTGALPSFDMDRFGRYAGAAVAEGAHLSLATAHVPGALVTLIESMLAVSANDRPTIDELHSQIRSVAADKSGWVDRPDGRPVGADTTDADPGRSRLRRSTLVHGGTATDATPAPSTGAKPAEPAASRLKGSGLGRRTKP